MNITEKHPLHPVKLFLILVLATTPTLFAAQYARPVSTVSTSGWSITGAATVHQAIDETSPNDSDYISVSRANSATATVQLSDVTDPEMATGHVMRLRIYTSGRSNPASVKEAK